MRSTLHDKLNSLPSSSRRLYAALAAVTVSTLAAYAVVEPPSGGAAPLDDTTVTVGSPTTVPPTTVPPATAVPVTTAVHASTVGPSTGKLRAGGGGRGDAEFLACVRWRESRGDYTVVNPDSGAAGAYQFLQSTWDNTARHAGRHDLVGVRPHRVAAATQDAMAQHLLGWYGRSPWYHPTLAC